MEKEILIHKYLDIGLSQEEERHLFDLLAKDDNMRVEFSRQVNIGKAIEEERRKVLPPAAVTSSIFGQLGYSIPAGLTPTAATIPFTHKLLPIIITALSTLLLPFLGYLGEGETVVASIPFAPTTNNFSSTSKAANPSDTPSEENTNDEELQMLAGKNISLQMKIDSIQILLLDYQGRLNNQQNSIAANSGSDVEYSNLLNKINQLESRLSIAQSELDQANGMLAIYRDIEQEETNNPVNNKNILGSSDLNRDQIYYDGKIYQSIADAVKESVAKLMAGTELSKSESDNKKSLSYEESSLLRNDRFPESDIYSDDSRKVSNPNTIENLKSGDLIFSIRYINTVSNPDISFSTTFQNWNFGLMGGYQIGKYVAAVVDVGVEQYGQSFLSLQNGREFIRQQSPDVFYYTAGARLNTSYLWGRLMPSIQLTAGASSLGPIFRGVGSIEYAAGEPISLSLNYESSMLLYYPQNQTESTLNSGFSVGIIYSIK
ncbi:MAG: hypothetical protein Kapaf2KO_22850 [Candidatus Kapaibacteriales bacterium]